MLVEIRVRKENDGGGGGGIRHNIIKLDVIRLRAVDGYASDTRDRPFLYNPHSNTVH